MRRRGKRIARRNRKNQDRNERQRKYRVQSRKRTCGGCNLCCFTYPLPELEKGRREWCKHVCPNGCSLHNQPRPPVCEEFKCMWLRNPTVPDRYRPDRIGCVASLQSSKVVHISQAFRNAAYKPDAYNFITRLTELGFAVVIFWCDATAWQIVSDTMNDSGERRRQAKSYIPRIQ